MKITLTNGSKYEYNGITHTATIVSIENNVVEYEGNIGFDKISDTANLQDTDEFAFYLPEFPQFGEVVIKEGNSYSIGDSAVSSGRASFALGREVTAAGDYAFAEGRDNWANYASHAEGRGNKAYGLYSHAEGSGNVASGEHSHVEGYKNKAFGTQSHAEG
jgi:hypothetical protein